MIDVTADKDAETRAAETERRFRMLAERGPAITFAYELDHTGGNPTVVETYVGPRIASVLGLQPREITGAPLPWFSAIHPHDMDAVMAQTQAAWRAGEPWSADYRMLAGDGHIVWFHEEGLATDRDEQGRPSRFQGVLLDVTERADAERALHQREHTLRELIQGVPAIPWTFHNDLESGKHWYSFVGPQSMEMLGYSPEEIIGESEHFPRLIHPDDYEQVNAGDAISEVTGLWDETYRVLTRDGAVRWVHSVGRRASDAGNGVTVWHGVTTDITELMRLTDGATMAPRERDEPVQPAG